MSNLIKRAEAWGDPDNSEYGFYDEACALIPLLTQRVIELEKQLAERDVEVNKLCELVALHTCYTEQLEQENAALREEVDALTECLNGSSKAVYTAEVFNTQMEKIRKQTAQECYKMVCSDEYVFGARNLAKAIKSKFGLEG